MGLVPLEEETQESLLALSLSLFLSCEHTESSRLQTGRECPPETNHDLGLLVSLTEKINLSVVVSAAQSMSLLQQPEQTKTASEEIKVPIQRTLQNQA